MNNVRDFGAVGNGSVKDTCAIQMAIDAGGIVYFPPGVYLTGTIYLRSNGGLELAPGAVLLASPDKEDYNADDYVPQNQAYPDDQVSAAHLISAVECENVVIRGGGKIDGSARTWLNEVAWVMGREGYIYPPWRPGQLIYFCESENISFQDVEVVDTPYWAVLFHGCEHVFIRNIRISNDMLGHNGDGIAIDCCRFVNISDCRIEGSDDCITLRGRAGLLKKQRNCEYVTVSNCILKTLESAIRIGVGDSSCCVRQAVFSNIIIQDAYVGVCICSNWKAWADSPSVEDMFFHDFCIEADRPFSIANYTCLSSKIKDIPAPGYIRKVHLRNWIGKSRQTANILANGGGEISSLVLQNINLELCGANEQAAEPSACSCHDGEPLLPAGVYIQGTSGTKIDALRCVKGENAGLWQETLRIEGASNLRVDNNPVTDDQIIFIQE